jgi:NADP-dependent 3-hydroxy acid dehydrogenase YdfG
MAGELGGRVAVVTGASSGIGMATARALAGAGAAVSLVARREDRLRALWAEIVASGGRAKWFSVDVTRRGEVEEATRATAAAFGGVDILVNNAGIMPLSALEALRVEEWEAMVDVNVKGVLFGVAAVLPFMLERGRGHIVNVGSVAGRRPFKTGAVYSATKFAVRAFSAGIHLELSAEKGIRVTDIQPGVVDTELAGHIPDPEARATFQARWEGKRMLTAQDVADAVLYAVSAPDRVNVNEILLRPTDQPT